MRRLAAGSGRDAVTLYRLTGGNPFFLTEALAAEGETVPATVGDAILARAARLSPEARAVLSDFDDFVRHYEIVDAPLAFPGS